ncbi:MAG: hypothetical protein POH28_10220 [Acidocella sp.]|nr:hypothetical protein [Acidocella sp.]
MNELGPPGQPSRQKHYPGFDDETYLRLNPDVRLAVMSGKFRNGQDHYEHYGRAEGRMVAIPSDTKRGQLLVTNGARTGTDLSKPPSLAVDSIQVSPSGGILLVGWINDTLDPLDSITLYAPGWVYTFDHTALARVSRPDARDVLGHTADHAHGVWGFSFVAQALPSGVCYAVLRLQSGRELGLMANADPVSDIELRGMALTQLAQAAYPGSKYFGAVASIAPSIGTQLAALNRILTNRAIAGPYVRQFGPRKPRYRGSIIICLYGRPEYMFLQAALFSRLSDFADYEFIYVSNSPELAETLLSEAQRCAHIYGLSVSLIILQGNAGFGSANNAAIAFAASDRLMFMNPDVFPRATDWAARHTALLEAVPAAQSALFGAPLYYDDGSLMHGGMFFATDSAPCFINGRMVETQILRVEHYGKGAPPDTPSFLRPRPVPAVSGAFISASRVLFERLGGFSQEYIFGHYEDADLCLKSIMAGHPPWLHNLPLWHLEGKGSHRHAAHEGASVVNRWLFTKIWAEPLVHTLLGPTPAHPALAVR